MNAEPPFMQFYGMSRTDYNSLTLAEFQVFCEYIRRYNEAMKRG